VHIGAERGAWWKSRIGIAVQAIGVAALAVIVYMAFLEPRDTTPLGSIVLEDGDRRGGATPWQAGDSQRRVLAHERRQQLRGKAQARARARARKRARARGRAALLAAAPSEPGPGVLARPYVGTPSDSQYTDAVTQILGRVAQSAP
jgi:hypothetical protein